MTEETIGRGPPQSWSLAGRRALVTGASRGIGRACALALGELGATVCVAARSADALEELHPRLPPGSRTIAVDLATAEGTRALLDALASWGEPHVVVANLRVRRPWSRIATLSSGALSQAMEENYAHLLALAPRALEAQRAAGFGRWIAVSSMAAALGGPGQAAYVAHKSALEGLMRTLAVEEGRSGITANVVAPGFVATEGARGSYDPATFDALASMNVIGRPATPEEVAHAVAFLATPLASYVTGVVLPVAGGTDLGWALTRLGGGSKSRDEPGRH